MKRFSIDRALPLLADIAFALYFAAEVAREHSLFSQGCMALFFCVIILYMIRRRKAFFSWWMAASLIVIFWALVVSFGWAIERSASLGMVKTLGVNLVFFIFFFQYLLLQGDMRRYMASFSIAVSALCLYALAREMPINLDQVRAGMAAGINPNWLGMLAAVAAGLCLYLAKRKNAFWLLPLLVLLPVVVLSKSAKALALTAMIMVIVLLILYPKRWWLKLLTLTALGAFAFYTLVYLENPLSNGILHRLHVMARYYFQGSAIAESIVARKGLISIAMVAFRERPLTGYGLSCFQFIDNIGTYSHNNFAELLVSGGAVLFALYYLPQLAALMESIRTAARNRRAGVVAADAAGRACVGVFIALMLAQIAMDYGMVSYFDRTAAVYFVLLVAASRIGKNRADDGGRFFAFLKNPRILFIWLAERGFFRNMGDEKYLKRFYRARFGRELRLDPPLTMNEKIQWLKLHDRDESHVRLVDKATVRDYVAQKAGAELLIDLLGVWDKPEQIDFKALPERFVLKCTHNSGGVIVCADKSAFDRKAAIKNLRAQLKKNYYWQGREWLYKNIPPRVMAEAFIGGADGSLPDDYKFFCFDGAVRAVCVCKNRSGKHAEYYFFDRAFDRLPVNEATVNMPTGLVIAKPARYDEMLRAAETLSAGLKHVRVDLYDTERGVRFGELTFFDQSGFADDYVGDGEMVMGEFLKLEEQA